MTMTFIPTTLIPFCVSTALLSMITQRHHLLMTLLALEAMILNLMFLILITSNLSSSMNMFLIMITLTYGTCEAALGLACLVKMSRMFGNDLIASTSSTSS